MSPIQQIHPAAKQSRAMTRASSPRWRGDNLRFTNEPRGFFRRRWTDIETRAPLESGHLGQLRDNFDVPMVVLVNFFSDWRRVNHQVVRRPVEYRIQPH